MEPTAQTGRSAWTVSRKLVAAVAAATTLGFAVVVGVQTVSRSTDALETARNHNLMTAEFLSGEISGAVRWNKAERIAPSFDRVANRDGATLAALRVFDAGDGVMADLARGAEAPDMASAAELAARAIEAGKPSSDVAGDHQLIAVPIQDPKSGDALGVAVSAWSLAPIHAQIEHDTMVSGALSFAILAALLALLARLLWVIVARPVREMTGAMDAIASGDTEVEVPHTRRADELGAMAAAVAVFKRKSEEVVSLAREREETEKRTAEARSADMNNLADEFEGGVSAIVKAVEDASAGLSGAAEDLVRTVDETRGQATTVAAAAEQATGNVQTVAAASEEMSHSIDEIGRQVEQSNTITQRAVGEAKSTDETIRSLSQAADRVGEVVGLISDIAEQTNLLALNATIEAARAGEAGKGFAVVADEVKTLANQTAKATEEIASTITSMQSETGRAVGAIEGISGTIGEVGEIAAAIAAAVEEQGGAIREIARNVQEAARGTQDVSAGIAQVSEASSGQGETASAVLDAARDLAAQAEKLSSQVNGFLGHIRAA